MSTFGERLRELRISKNLTQDRLAENFYINKTSISRYENGVQFPELDLLIKLADFFKVSLDYLLCRTDEKNINTPDKNSEKKLKKLETNEKLLNFINLANNIPDIKKIDIIFANRINYLSENEINLIMSYFEELGFNIPRILSLLSTHTKSDNKLKFESYADNMYFISEEITELIRECNLHIEHLKETKGKPIKINGITNYPL